MNRIVGTICVNKDEIYTSNTNIAYQYADKIQLLVNFEDDYYSDTALTFMYSQDLNKNKSAALTYDYENNLITLPQLQKSGKLYIQMYPLKDGIYNPTNVIDFYIGESVNIHGSNIPDLPTALQVAEQLMKQIYERDYKTFFDVMLNKFNEQNENVSNLQKLINLAINSCGQYKFENGFLFFKQANGTWGEGINLNVSVEEFENVVSRVTSLETNGVAIGDTLGIGSQVVYNGEDIPTGWKEVEVPFSNPNLLINNYFQVWQRGEKFTNIGLKYSADRWCIYSTTSNCVIEKVDNGVHISTDGKVIMRQFIETIILEKTMTFSVQYNNKIAKVNGVFNEGNSNVYTDNGVSVTFRKLSEQPYMTLFIEFDEPDITANWVKLEYGELATPFVSRPYAEELMLCQRYYQLYENMPILMTMRNGNYHYYYMNLITHTRTNGTVTLVNESIVDTNSNTMYSTPLSDFLYETNSKRLVARKTSSLPQHSVLLSSKIIIDAEIY